MSTATWSSSGGLPLLSRGTSTAPTDPTEFSRSGIVRRGSLYTGSQRRENDAIEKPEGYSLRRRATTISKPGRAHNNLLGFLSIAQSRNIDLIGITWQEALGRVGKGGEGEIFQSDLSIQDRFVFKRSVDRRYPSELFRELASEVSVLGHPRIREHPNIILLEGICWEVSEKGWFTAEKVWPVLVLEKAPHGDLERFMRSEKGKAMSIESRMQMCAEIGSAIKTMHTNQIVHGDIKPKNTLVFDNGSNGFTPKLTDFGYSTVYSGESEVRMPQSKPWDPPERDQKFKFPLSDAKKMDVYSFGVLCLWVLFREDIEDMGKSLPQGWVSLFASFFYTVAGVPKEEQEWRKPKPDIAALAHLRDSRRMQEYALDLIDRVPSLSDERRQNLRTLFQWTLSCDKKDRQSDVKKIILLLGRDRYPYDSEVPDVGIELHGFSVARDLQSLCQADYRVREEMILALQQQYDSQESSQKEKLNAAFELAFCTKIGLGTPKDEAKSEDWLKRSGYIRDIQHEIELSKPEKKMFNERLRRLYDRGILKPIDNALEYRKCQDLEVIERRCQQEINDVGEALGKTHPAVLSLKSTLASILRDQGNPRLLSVLEEMVEDLTNDLTRGPDDRYRALMKNDLALELLRPGSLDEGDKMLRECYANAKRILGMDHVTTLMVGMNLADCLQIQGKAKAAHELAQSALSGFRMTLGELHRYTIGVKTLYQKRLMLEGKFDIAEDEQRDLLQKIKDTLGNDDPMTIGAAIELITMLLMTGQFKEAERVKLDFLKGMNPSNGARELFDEPITADILLHEERYDEAAVKFQEMRVKMGRLPWPPPKIPQRPRQDTMKGGADPEDFPNNPDLLDSSAKYAVAMQAQAQVENKLGREAQASQCYWEARKVLRQFMIDMSKIFGGDQWVGVGTESGLGGSALSIAMAKGYGYSLQILVSVGAFNARDGIHYKEAIKVAADERLPNVVAILQEHQLLCGGTQHSPGFENRGQLRYFLDGDWRGSYLYATGGFRKDKKGEVIFTIRSSDNPSDPGVVSIEGTGCDDRGETEYTGEVTLDGRFTIWFSLKGEGADMAWEYSGYLNMKRRAMGGRWGFRSAVLPLGSNFFYKD